MTIGLPSETSNNVITGNAGASSTRSLMPRIGRTFHCQHVGGEVSCHNGATNEKLPRTEDCSLCLCILSCVSFVFQCQATPQGPSGVLNFYHPFDLCSKILTRKILFWAGRKQIASKKHQKHQYSAKIMYAPFLISLFSCRAYFRAMGCVWRAKSQNLCLSTSQTCLATRYLT